jgi:hypothetical protein
MVESSIKERLGNVGNMPFKGGKLKEEHLLSNDARKPR